MTRHEARAVEVAVARLCERLAADPRLRAEVHRARREFFGSDAPAAAKLLGAADTAEHRFAEWFALERESETLGAVPIETPPFDQQGKDLTGSLAGVFLVLVDTDGEVEVSDLQDGEVLDLAVPPGSLKKDDLLVGRLFPQPSGKWSPSTAAAVFRPGLLLAEAFRSDVGRIALDRRLRQIELEHLMLRRPDQTPSPTAALVDQVPLEHLEAELDRLLQQGGSEKTATGVSRELALVVRPGQVIGPLLEELAFDTQVDLDAARRVLLQIWNVYHGVAETDDAAPSAPPPGETLGERLVRTLDEGLRQKRDVEELFAQLEQMAGLEPGASDDEENPFDDEGDEEDEPGEEESDPDDEPDDDAETEAGGDLGPLVQEYLWETGRERDPTAAALTMWPELQENASVPHRDLVDVTGVDLVRLLLHCYLGAPPDQRAATVQSAFDELRRFYEWARDTHELDQTAVLRECRGAIVEQADRLQAAGLALSTTGRPSTRPAILRIEDVSSDGCGVLDDEGGHHWLALPRSAAALLRVGDLVLGALDPSAPPAALVGMVVVLPADARTLME